MHEIFEFRKELNIKKIIIVVLIFFIIITIICLKLFFPSEKSLQTSQKNNAKNTNYSIFYSNNKKVSLNLSNDYNFIQYAPTNNYILELRNANNLGIFISEEKLIEDHTLSEVVTLDLDSYISQFNNSTNISNISEFDRGRFSCIYL